MSAAAPSAFAEAQRVLPEPEPEPEADAEDAPAVDLALRILEDIAESRTAAEQAGQVIARR